MDTLLSASTHKKKPKIKVSLKVTFFMLLGIVLVIGLIVLIKTLQIRALIEAGKNFEVPPVTISTSIAKKYEWQDAFNAVGSLESAKGVIITADLPGRISKIHFDAGAEVKKGDLLVEQEVSSERAQLRAAQANVTLAKNNLDRLKELLVKKVVSKAEYDRAEAEYKSAIANADSARASVTKKNIIAPFSGRLGIRLVNLGQDINEGSNIVSLQSVNPMFVNFSIPQQHLTQLNTGYTINLVSDALPDKTFVGKITAINPQIDAKTRSVKIQGTLKNPDRLLLPGMFASVKVLLPDVKPVILIPITAIQYATYGDSIFIIEQEQNKQQKENQTQGGSLNPSHQGKSYQKDKSKLIARQQFVKLGRARGDFVSVLDGLKEGQEVASAGVFKLRNGSPVSINNTIEVNHELAPSPSDQ